MVTGEAAVAILPVWPRMGKATSRPGVLCFSPSAIAIGAALVLIILFPPLVTWLPKLVLGR